MVPIAAAHEVRGNHHAPPVEAIAHDPSDQQEDDHGQAPRHAHHGHRGGRVRKLVDLPRERDEGDAVADHRHGHARPQQGEVPDGQRPDYLEPVSY
jgi:hypothetical protein